MKNNKTEIVQSLLKETNGRFFSVEFIKKDGTPRRMLARLGVRKNLKGVGLAYVPEERGNMVVYDMVKRQYRTISMDTVIKIKINGVEVNL